MAVLHSLQTIITLLIVLSILVVAHEWGHFIIARLFGIRVDDFSIGFGKRIARLGKRGDTEYNLRMLPLGGFVKIAGMEADEAPLIQAKEKVMGKGANDDPDARQLPLIAENTAEAEPYTAPDGFNTKPLWQRSLVILAGPVMSFLFGYVLLCLIGTTVGWPTGQYLNRVDLVSPGGEAQRIDLRSGDFITAVNGQPITDGQQLIETIRSSGGRPVTLTVRRDGQTLTKVGTPRPYKDADGKPLNDVSVRVPGALGPVFGLRPGDLIEGINDAPIKNGDQALKMLRDDVGKSATIIVNREAEGTPLTGTVPASLSTAPPVLNTYPASVLEFSPAAEHKRVGLGESIGQGNRQLVGIFVTFASLLKHHELKQSAGGIIFMYQATHLAVQTGAFSQESTYKTLSLMAQLSISLFIFNLLPIPILDGGHLLTFFIEWVRRGKKLTEQQQQAFLMTGLAIIGVLFVLVMSNDILRTLHHQLPQ